MVDGSGGSDLPHEVQESQMHAADIAGILDQRESIIGGRDAISAAEFVRPQAHP